MVMMGFEPMRIAPKVPETFSLTTRTHHHLIDDNNM